MIPFLKVGHYKTNVQFQSLTKQKKDEKVYLISASGDLFIKLISLYFKTTLKPYR